MSQLSVPRLTNRDHRLGSPKLPVPRNFHHKKDEVVPCVRSRAVVNGYGVQPQNSLVRRLSPQIILDILQHVSQFELVSLALSCSLLHPLAIDRLYRRVTVVLNPQVPVKYRQNTEQFIRDNGIKYMDSALILRPSSFIKFYLEMMRNPQMVQRIKFFVFDKCSSDVLAGTDLDLHTLQARMMTHFANHSTKLNFLHITFIDFTSGMHQLTEFLRYPNIRNQIFKLFITNLKNLHTPKVPPGITNLFMMLDEYELERVKTIDLDSPEFSCITSLFTLTCRTNRHLGLQVIRLLKLPNNNDSRLKLQLKGFSLYHCHNKRVATDIIPLILPGQRTPITEIDDDDYIQAMEKTLRFDVIDSKIDLTRLSHLFLKVDCVEHRNRSCDCFPQFFNDFASYLINHQGLPNLTSLEVELFPNYEWLRPQQLLEGIIRPVGRFIRTLSLVSRLSLDLTSPGFKIFDGALDLSSTTLNKMNEQLLESFILSIYAGQQNNNPLRVLQLPDFVTSFIYYKPEFYESLLHTCTCWGCNLVLERLRDLFFPLPNHDDFSAYYVILGYILSKLQTDREVCIPIKQRTYNYSRYPMHRGQPHALHHHFHTDTQCQCNIDNDPRAEDPNNIDNLVIVYLIHQLRPIVGFLARVFRNIDKLMIQGIHYERDCCRFVPVFDDERYPPEFLQAASHFGNTDVPNLPFGKFR